MNRLPHIDLIGDAREAAKFLGLAKTKLRQAERHAREFHKNVYRRTYSFGENTWIQVTAYAHRRGVITIRAGTAVAVKPILTLFSTDGDHLSIRLPNKGGTSLWFVRTVSIVGYRLDPTDILGNPIGDNIPAVSAPKIASTAILDAELLSIGSLDIVLEEAMLRLSYKAKTPNLFLKQLNNAANFNDHQTQWITLFVKTNSKLRALGYADFIVVNAQLVFVEERPLVLGAEKTAMTLYFVLRTADDAVHPTLDITDTVSGFPTSKLKSREYAANYIAEIDMGAFLLGTTSTPITVSSEPGLLPGASLSHIRVYGLDPGLPNIPTEPNFLINGTETYTSTVTFSPTYEMRDTPEANNVVSFVVLVIGSRPEGSSGPLNLLGTTTGMRVTVQNLAPGGSGIVVVADAVKWHDATDKVSLVANDNFALGHRVEDNFPSARWIDTNPSGLAQVKTNPIATVITSSLAGFPFPLLLPTPDVGGRWMSTNKSVGGTPETLDSTAWIADVFWGVKLRLRSFVIESSIAEAPAGGQRIARHESFTADSKTGRLYFSNGALKFSAGSDDPKVPWSFNSLAATGNDAVSMPTVTASLDILYRGDEVDHGSYSINWGGGIGDINGVGAKWDKVDISESTFGLPNLNQPYGEVPFVESFQTSRQLIGSSVHAHPTKLSVRKSEGESALYYKGSEISTDGVQTASENPTQGQSQILASITTTSGHIESMLDESEATIITPGGAFAFAEPVSRRTEGVINASPYGGMLIPNGSALLLTQGISPFFTTSGSESTFRTRPLAQSLEGNVTSSPSVTRDLVWPEAPPAAADIGVLWWPNASNSTEGLCVVQVSDIPLYTANQSLWLVGEAGFLNGEIDQATLDLKRAAFDSTYTVITNNFAVLNLIRQVIPGSTQILIVEPS